MTLTIAVPTIGREGLANTLASIARQALIPGDQVLIVYDSFERDPVNAEATKALVDRYGFTFVEHDGGLHFYGNPQLNHAMSLATGDFFLALGDDDIYTDGAIARLRPQLVAGQVALGQFLSPWRMLLWSEPELAITRISGCCMVCPTSALVPVKLEQRVEVDFDWIEDCLLKTGQPPIWIEDCLIVARPDVDARGVVISDRVQVCAGCHQPKPVRDLNHGRCQACLVKAKPVITATTRPLRILLVHPGANSSTCDVYNGLSAGLRSHGVEVLPYRLDERIDSSHKYLHVMWRQKKKSDPTIAKPNIVDEMLHAGSGAVLMAHRHQVDAVVVVSAMLLHPDVIVLMKRSGLPVTVLFTESPYDHADELRIAAMVDGCWTHERAMVPSFRTVNPRAGYLPHGWHPELHKPVVDTTPGHDVVFVGTGFPERVAFFNSIDWTGLDLGLYGNWDVDGMTAPVQHAVLGGIVSNMQAAELYRRAKVNLNLYRRVQGWGTKASALPIAESLSPRAYELAACGVFHLSDYRAEVPEVFGDLVPTFRTPSEAGRLIRRWVDDAEGRRRIAQQLPACVAEASWSTRAQTVLGDLHHLLAAAA